MNKLFVLIIFLASINATGGCQSTSLPYPELSIQKAAALQKKQVVPTRLLDSLQIVSDISFLASDSCEGRKPGSIGHARAVERILLRMRAIGLDSFDNALIAPFIGRQLNGTSEGKNIIGWIKGSKEPGKYLVISAHYDHIGRNKQGAIYYGADDNASGVACMLSLAKYFKKNPQPYSIIFAAFDREESGLEGALKYVEQLEEKNKVSSIKFNLNLDMVARTDSNELYASGIRHYPSYQYVVNQVKDHTNAYLLMGHDYGSFRDDWTMLSDQYAFHKRNIPFIYISVEDHADYHKITDTVDRINLSRLIENCNTILLMAKAIKLN